MSDRLRQELRRRLDDLFASQPVVVWRDPSGVMGTLLREVLPSDVEMPVWNGNPLSLRAQIDEEDPWLERRWLLYVPRLPDGVECDWLADYESSFLSMPDGTLSWALQEFFALPESAELRRALDSSVAADLALQFGHHFPSGPERLVPEEVQAALLRAALKAPAADEVELVLRYLSSDADAARLSEHHLLAALTGAIKSRLGLRRNLIDGQPPDRGALCRCMVASALVETGVTEARPLSNHLPQEGYRPRWAGALDRALRDTGRREAIVRAIDEALEASDLKKALTDPLALAHGPALPVLDRHIERLLLDGCPEDDGRRREWYGSVAAVAGERAAQVGLDDATRERWRILQAAAGLAERCQRRIAELAAYPAAALDRLAREYVEPDGGDWRIDALHRELPAVDDLGEAWTTTLLAPARQAYHAWTKTLTRQFTRAVEIAGRYSVDGFLPQTAFWYTLVGEGARTAVLLVDALRVDLAHELAHTLESRGYSVALKPALAQLPTRTEVGMAALLPDANTGFAVRVDGGKLVSFIGAARLPGIVERWRHAERVLAAQGRQLVRRELDELLRDPSAIEDAVAKGRIVVATTTDVDEGGPIAAKVDYGVFGEVLEKCRRFVVRAFEAGVGRVVVGSDHGFLVRSPEAASGGVPGTAPSGGELARGLRYAAREGDVGEVAPELLHISAKALGRAGADVFVPRDTSCLAVQGGPGLFVHGGLSPEEAVLVFLDVRPGSAVAERTYVPLGIQAPPRSTSLAFKITVTAAAVDAPLLALSRRVKVKVFDARGDVAWSSEELMFAPRASAKAETLLAKVSRGGDYVVALQDAATAYSIGSATVAVDVLDNGGFEF